MKAKITAPTPAEIAGALESAPALPDYYHDVTEVTLKRPEVDGHCRRILERCGPVTSEHQRVLLRSPNLEDRQIGLAWCMYDAKLRWEERCAERESDAKSVLAAAPKPDPFKGRPQSAAVITASRTSGNRRPGERRAKAPKGAPRTGRNGWRLGREIVIPATDGTRAAVGTNDRSIGRPNPQPAGPSSRGVVPGAGKKKHGRK